MPAETNESGPAGTYGCKCVASNARTCYEMQHGYQTGDASSWYLCECLCHQWSGDADDAR
jgi:hypothetical protein